MTGVIIMKKNRLPIILTMALALALVLGACSAFFSPDTSSVDSSSSKGTLITLGVGPIGARAVTPVVPAVADFDWFRVTITGAPLAAPLVLGNTAADAAETAVLKTVGGSLAVMLESGTYSVTVEAYKTFTANTVVSGAVSASTEERDYLAASGTASLTVGAGPNTVNVTLLPGVPDAAGAPKGLFAWRIRLPVGTTAYTVELDPIAPTGTAITLDTYTGTALTAGTNSIPGTTAAQVELPAGTYWFNISASGADGAFAQATELVYL
jgi:hypothetical protein